MGSSKNSPVETFLVTFGKKLFKTPIFAPYGSVEECHSSVIPAKAGIQNLLKRLDSRLHGNDRISGKLHFSTSPLGKNCRQKMEYMGLFYSSFLAPIFNSLE